jgi:hypothetical protein
MAPADQRDAADDQQIPSDHQGDQPDRQPLAHGQGNVDAIQQDLVGQRVEVGAESGLGIEALGDEAVDRVRQSRREK